MTLTFFTVGTTLGALAALEVGSVGAATPVVASGTFFAIGLLNKAREMIKSKTLGACPGTVTDEHDKWMIYFRSRMSHYAQQRLAAVGFEEHWGDMWDFDGEKEEGSTQAAYHMKITLPPEALATGKSWYAPIFCMWVGGHFRLADPKPSQCLEVTCTSAAVPQEDEDFEPVPPGWTARVVQCENWMSKGQNPPARPELRRTSRVGNEYVVAPSKKSKLQTGLQPLPGTARILDGVHAPRVGQRLLWAVAEQKDGTEANINL